MSNEYNITVLQGSDKTINIVVKSDGTTPDDLTGYTAKMQVRETPTDETVLDELTTENGRITITAIEGKIELIFPNTTTTNYDFENAVYDLELMVGTPVVVNRLLQGSFTVDYEVTR